MSALLFSEQSSQSCIHIHNHIHNPHIETIFLHSLLSIDFTTCNLIFTYCYPVCWTIFWRDQPRIDEYFTLVLVPLLWLELEHVTADNITKAGCQVNLLQNIQWGRTLVFCGCDDCHIPPSTHPQLFTLPINTMKCCNLHVTSESNTSQGFCRTEK